MKNFKRIYIASVLLLSGAVGFAAETSYNASASTFLDVAERIVDGNEALKAEDATLQAEIEALRAEAVPENPEVEFEHLWSAGEADNKWNIGVTQSLPWPGTFGARRKAASLLAEARTSGMEQSRRELRLRVLQSLADIVAANRRVEILSELHRSMIELREAYERAWQHGETTILDLNKMKIETVRSLSELQQAESQRQTLIHELQALAGNSGDPAETALTLTDFPLLELAPLDAYLAGVDRSPEIEYLRAMQAVERQNVAVAKASRLHAFQWPRGGDYPPGLFTPQRCGLRPQPRFGIGLQRVGASPRDRADHRFRLCCCRLCARADCGLCAGGGECQQPGPAAPGPRRRADFAARLSAGDLLLPPCPARLCRPLGHICAPPFLPLPLSLISLGGFQHVEKLLGDADGVAF